MPVTNTHGAPPVARERARGHLRNIRNPIWGFDLHKPTLDRVTGTHLALSGSTAQRWPLPRACGAAFAIAHDQGSVCVCA